MLMVPLHSNKTLTKEVVFICLFGFFVCVRVNMISMLTTLHWKTCKGDNSWHRLILFLPVVTDFPWVFF